MNKYTVYVTRYNDLCDKQWQDKIKHFTVADWTPAQLKLGNNKLFASYPPLAIFPVQGVHDEEAQRLLANKVCDAANKMHQAQLGVDITI